MSASRSTLQIVKYLHREPTTRGRSNSILEIKTHNGVESYTRDYSEDVGSGSYGEVYRLKLVLENNLTKTVLAKKEKPQPDGSYLEGYNMKREAMNWAEIAGFGGYVGDEKSNQEPHIVIMPDLANKTTVPIKNVRYNNTTEFLLFMCKVLDKIDDFHNEHQMVHYDMTENNVLADTESDQVKFVDFGLARKIGEEVHAALYHEKCHSGSSSGYFPPELNPLLRSRNSIDKTAQTTHDVYIIGRMLSRMIAKHAIDKHGKSLVFLPGIKEEFEIIVKAMQEANTANRINLTTATRRMMILARINELLEKQDALSVRNVIMTDLAQTLLDFLDGNTHEIHPFVKYFEPKNQNAFLQLFGINQAKQYNDEMDIPSVRPRH